MQQHKPKGIKRLIKAFGYSLEGIAAVFKTEEAFRIELVTATILTPVVFLLELSAGERALLMFSLLLVLIAELTNSAVETLVERISSDIHPLSKRAKDIGSAVVLLSLVNAAVVWGIVLLGQL